MANEPLDQAKRELARIPRGALPQNTFRMIFFAWRLNSLGSHPEVPSADLRWIVERATEAVRVTWPDFEPGHNLDLS